jgi:hypothetical protein
MGKRRRVAPALSIVSLVRKVIGSRRSCHIGLPPTSLDLVACANLSRTLQTITTTTIEF